ncbi:MAG TPA: c-type cytochrome [Bacteroidales bacterium]|nr:c-type cytochrome [Bacteroidales bacterium]
MKTLKLSFMTITLVAFTAFAAAQNQEKPKPWPVPDEFKNMKNPVAMNDASTKSGATMYNKFCASCHGKTGKGDGVKARALKTFPGDFTAAEYQKQTDGEFFYKTKFGRGEMPKYEGKATDNDIWNMVNYMRTFKAQK